jgi:hypothetical protein
MKNMMTKRFRKQSILLWRQLGLEGLSRHRLRLYRTVNTQKKLASVEASVEASIEARVEVGVAAIAVEIMLEEPKYI